MFENPLVVGYKGEIGSFILQGLLKFMPKAGNIWCFDINEDEFEKQERIKKSDYIFLCVPLEETEKWIRKYMDLLKGKVIVEQCSLKTAREWNYFESLGIEFIHMHILFRPSSTPNPDDRECMILTGPELSEHDKEFGQAMKTILGTSKVYATCITLDEHDLEMAKQQALVHKAILVLDGMMHNNYGETFIVKKIGELADRIRSGDKKLYARIQHNKYAGVATIAFEQKLKVFDIDKYMP